jgi:hypothetical protein
VIGCTSDPAMKAYYRGRADAEKEIANNLWIIEMSCRPLPSDWAHEYQEVLKTEYRIRFRCVDEKHPRDSRATSSRIKGHNDVVIPEIERRLGTNVWANAETKARKRIEQTTR